MTILELKSGALTDHCASLLAPPEQTRPILSTPLGLEQLTLISRLLSPFPSKWLLELPIGLARRGYLQDALNLRQPGIS